MQTIVEIQKTEEQLRSVWGMGFKPTKSTEQETVQVVIDISEELYQMCRSCLGDTDCIESAIANGTPLTDILDKIRAEIEKKIEQERFARAVFRGEEKDAVKAEQCTGSIFAYNNVIKLIDKYMAESEE